MNRSHVLWITRTAILIALLVSVQAATAPLAAIPLLRQLVAGSLINMILVVSVMAASLSTGITVGAISPVFASLLGVVPGWQWPLVPVIGMGNAVFVVIWYLLSNRDIINKYITRGITIGLAAAAKFLVLFVGVVQVLLRVLDFMPNQINALSTTFSVTQLFTASIGGVLATLALPVIHKAIRRG